MLSFIYNNQSIIIVVGIVLLLLLGAYLAKKMPTKVNKKQVEKKDKNSESTDVKVEKKESNEHEIAKTEVKSDTEEKVQTEDDLSKKQDKKPKIIQIYKRSERQDEGLDKSKKDLDPIYNRNVEFINTSKNIAKFKSFVEDEKQIEAGIDEVKDEFGFVASEQEGCEFCEDKVKHFDHSKRLSSIMKDGEDMFASHISDKYLNVDTGKHLNTARIEQMINLRTDQMFKNSEKKINCDCEQDDCNCVTCEECDDILEDEVNVDMKTALIADTYFKRKNRR